jgi:hypothetical protein
MREVSYMVLNVDESKWIYGTGNNGRLADLRNNRFCIVGMYLHALGVPEKVLGKGKTSADVKDHIPPEGRWLLECYKEPKLTEVQPDRFLQHITTSQLISRLNDEENLSSNERKLGLTPLFKEHGVDLKFGA